MPIIRRWSGGYVDSRDRSDLAPNECQTLTGAWYKPGDPDPWKIDGRTTFGNTSQASIRGLAVCQFDSGVGDILVALAGALLLYKNPTPSDDMTMTSVVDPNTANPLVMSAASAHLSAAYYRGPGGEFWYLCTGYENKVLKNDASPRDWGMIAPPQAITATLNTATSTPVRPTASDGTFTNSANAYDTGTDKFDTFAHKYYKNAAGSSTVIVFQGFGSNTDTGRKLYVAWSLATDNQGDFGAIDKILNAKVTIKIEKSENSGSAWTTLLDMTTTVDQALQETSIGWTNGVNPGSPANTGRVRVTYTYVSGFRAATIRVHDVRIQANPSAAAAAVSSLRYAFTEFDQVNQVESAPSPITEVPSGTLNSVTLALPSAVTNTATTHWRIYRAPDQGTDLQLGRIATIPKTETTFIDDFSMIDKDTQATPVVDYVKTTAPDGSALYIPRNMPPPLLRDAVVVDGMIVGIDATYPSRLVYSVPGLPEYFPAINSLPISTDKRDEMWKLHELGGSLIVLSSAAIYRLDEMPRQVGGVLIASKLTRIEGAPGTVGPKASDVVHYQGRSWVAYISAEDGIILTDGHTWRSISDDVNWQQFRSRVKSGWVLRWLPHFWTLVMCYATTGTTNDKYFLFHLHESHIKADGRAKVSGPNTEGLNDLAVGIVGGLVHVYGGESDTGWVYREFVPEYGSTHDLTIKGPRRRDAGWGVFGVLDANLYHTDFGSGETATLAYLTGRDANQAEATRSQSVSLAGNRGTQLDVFRSGEYHEETITYTATATGAIRSLTLRTGVTAEEGGLE